MRCRRVLTLPLRRDTQRGSWRKGGSLRGLPVCAEAGSPGRVALGEGRGRGGLPALCAIRSVVAEVAGGDGCGARAAARVVETSGTQTCGAEVSVQRGAETHPHGHLEA
eukprot:3144523-Prymnesium_polylepis.1